MAELPDLTVFASTLNDKFKGETLKSLEVIVSKKLNLTSSELQNKLEGEKLETVRRVGKTLQLSFGKNNILGLHLMLKGELKEITAREPLPRHTILAFHFSKESGFAVTDPFKQATATLNPPENKIPDALDIKQADFLTLLSKKSKRIKELLMDQKLIRGIGNSYSDEILWEARISPFSVAKSIPDKNAKVLYKKIDEVLTGAIAAIKKENKDELQGELRDFMKIHSAKIKNSPTGQLIETKKIAGRTAYFTPEQILYK